MAHRFSIVAALIVATAAPVLAQDAAIGEPGPGAAFIAGTDPSQRPAGAPVITEFVKSDEWYQAALTGVSEPYPASLGFLDDQGAWFTPFIHPGMTAPYDIRGWHSAE
ncbi:MAG: hypothetical protein ACK5LJ_14445 [Paracoccus sp. (in: a-proteobacteria)]